MKLKKYLSFMLALCLVFTMTSPAFAVEGTEQPSGEIVEAADPTQPEVKDEQPADPETPVEPEQPEAPEQPTDPEQPVDPENPEPPAQPENPEQPVTPTEPAQPVTPVQPEQPVTPVQPETPEFPDDISGLGRDELEALLGREDLSDEQRELLESAIESIDKKAADEAFAASLEGLTLEELDALLDDETLTSAQRLLVKKAIAAAKANVDIPDMTDWTVEEIYEFYLTLEGNDTAIQKLFEALTWEQEVELSDYIYEMNGGDGVIDSEAMTDASEPLMPPIDVEMRALSPRRKTAKYNLFSVYSEGNTKENSEGVVADKTVKAGENPGEYTLTLDAFVTGEKTSSSTTKRVPIDAVLVLDVSGSMDENISSSRSSYKRVYSKSGISTGYYSTYYVKTDSGYIQVSYSYRSQAWMDNSGNTYKPKASPLDMSENRVQFYTQGTVKRIEALRDSVTGFVEALAKDAKENNVQHRVSLIAYSTEVQDTMSCGLELVIDSNGNVNSDLETLINRLSAKGSTYPNLAMEEAVKVFNDTASVGSNDVVNGNAARQRVTVLFTDGMPGYASGSKYQSDDSAEMTIKFARVLKESTDADVTIETQDWYTKDGNGNTVKGGTQGYTGKGCGSTVYTVGMMSGLDPKNTDPVNQRTSKENRYLHYVSSNYLTADGLEYNRNYSRTTGENGNPKYYLSANDADSLNEIFTNIVDSVIGGEAAVALDGTTVVRDVLSGDVVLNYSGAKADAVRVYTVDYLGEDNFSGTRKEITNDVDVDLSADGTIDVSGFDFAANYVWDNADGVEGKTFGGKKLIIEIDIKAKKSFGGNNIKTNAENNQSLIFKGDEENGFYYFTSPTVDVELDYKIAAEGKTIYLGNDTNVHDLLKYADGYEPDGDNNKYVDITYTVKNSSGTVIGIYTIKAGKTEGTWSDKFDSIELSDCADYTIECEVTADHSDEDPDGTKGSQYYVHLPDNEKLEIKGDEAETATIHVLKPTITAMDIWANYGTDVDLGVWSVVRDANNVLKVTDWTDSTHSSYPTPVEGTAPAVSLAEVEKKTGDGTLTGLNYMTGTDDSDFDITKITISNKPFDKSHFTVVKAVENEEHDFTVHINHFDLKVTKEVTKGDTNLYGNTFVFTVKDGNDEIVEFVLGNGEHKTITGLLCGKSYTVSEDESWSWRYTADNSNATVRVGEDHKISNTEVETCKKDVTVNNSLTGDKWLTDEQIKTNEFTSGLKAAVGS